MEDSERDSRVVSLLEDCVRTELTNMNAFLELGLADKSIENLTQAVTSSVLYGFAVDWSPDWIKAGDVHSWQAKSGEWMARCATCLVDSPPSRERDEAVTWARQHEASH